MKVAVYTRISSDQTGDGLGVARQEHDARQLCETRGWQVADVYTDNDTSAYKGLRRDNYERMLADVEAGTIDAVVAWHPDRLHRSPVELERFIDVIERHSVQVATVQGGEYDLSTASGRMTARVVGAVARHESEHKSERLRRKHEELAQAGAVSGGGTRPFGFLDDRVTVRADEAAVIVETVARVAAGEALRGLVADLNRRGTLTPTGKPWAPFTLRRMVTSPRIAGLRQHQGEIAAVATWPAIVDRETWETCRRVLLDPARRTNQTVRSYLLTGYLRCGLCGTDTAPGAKLVARPRGDKARSYVCATGPGFKGCGKIRALAQPLEDWVVDAVLTAVDGREIRDSLARPEPSDGGVAVELAEVERRLDSLAEDFGAGVISRREWLAARRRLDGRRDGLHSRLMQRTRTSALSLIDGDGDLTERWAALTFHQQRAVLDVVIDDVTVNPAVKGRNFFDPNRFTIHWM